MLDRSVNHFFEVNHVNFFRKSKSEWNAWIANPSHADMPTVLVMNVYADRHFDWCVCQKMDMPSAPALLSSVPEWVKKIVVAELTAYCY